MENIDVEINETEEFYKNPIAATPELQKKYLGITYAEYKRNESYEGAAKEGFEIKEQELFDPFMQESYKINVLVEIIPETPKEELDALIISDKIKELKIKVAN